MWNNEISENNGNINKIRNENNENNVASKVMKIILNNGENKWREKLMEERK
jgi:hypothetical protein